MKKQRCYIADGSSVCQAFEKFSDARRCADRAPWANGLVYRAAQDWRDSAGFQPAGRLCYTAPNAPYSFPERGGLFEEDA